jgi:undecaprenyl-diphosphatase
MRSVLKERFPRLFPISRQMARNLVLVGTVAFFGGLFLRISGEVGKASGIDQWDQSVLDAIATLRRPALNGVAVDITALGSAPLITLFTLLGLLVVGLNRDWRDAKYLTAGSAGAALWTELLKNTYIRNRPPPDVRLVEATGFSYPSGHSFAATAFYLVLAFLMCRYFQTYQARAALITFATAVAVSVCFSRLYLGVHYPSDVLTGFLLGASWALVLTGLFFRPRRS